jgi:hypothetical protein
MMDCAQSSIQRWEEGLWTGIGLSVLVMLLVVAACVLVLLWRTRRVS